MVVKQGLRGNHNTIKKHVVDKPSTTNTHDEFPSSINGIRKADDTENTLLLYGSTD
jgi:hypothetical protein